MQTAGLSIKYSIGVEHHVQDVHVRRRLPMKYPQLLPTMFALMGTVASLLGQSVAEPKADMSTGAGSVLAKPRQTKAPAGGKKWRPARTRDGQPDLRGVWTNSSRVPLERPKELGSREFYTEQEVAENAKRGLRGDRPTKYAVTQYDISQYGLETGQDKVA